MIDLDNEEENTKIKLQKVYGEMKIYGMEKHFQSLTKQLKESVN